MSEPTLEEQASSKEVIRRGLDFLQRFYGEDGRINVTLMHETLRRAETERDFYKRRCDALQKQQKAMRDPEREMVCDILANGVTYLSAVPEGTD